MRSCSFWDGLVGKGSSQKGHIESKVKKEGKLDERHGQYVSNQR